MKKTPDSRQIEQAQTACRMHPACVNVPITQAAYLLPGSVPIARQPEFVAPTSIIALREL